MVGPPIGPFRLPRPRRAAATVAWAEPAAVATAGLLGIPAEVWQVIGGVVLGAVLTCLDTALVNVGLDTVCRDPGACPRRPRGSPAAIAPGAAAHRGRSRSARRCAVGWPRRPAGNRANRSDRRAPADEPRAVANPSPWFSPGDDSHICQVPRALRRPAS
ncbi:hypothetical protein; putative signal peptide [Frankia alni ACN14a]|uniref:Uncharacterized protein n=1 Tax=Frankia alni (strain DSM 45986 / CECT 9034 / ACN14a) TaxID=326424 RepID=Q0RHG6_FRAAA|nr:hypothetical protein; putative signal peptide [Frankia alni ACN14a]